MAKEVNERLDALGGVRITPATAVNGGAPVGDAAGGVNWGGVAGPWPVYFADTAPTIPAGAKALWVKTSDSPPTLWELP